VVHVAPAFLVWARLLRFSVKFCQELQPKKLPRAMQKSGKLTRARTPTFPDRILHRLPRQQAPFCDACISRGLSPCFFIITTSACQTKGTERDLTGSQRTSGKRKTFSSPKLGHANSNMMALVPSRLAFPGIRSRSGAPTRNSVSDSLCDSTNLENSSSSALSDDRLNANYSSLSVHCLVTRRFLIHVH